MYISIVAICVCAVFATIFFALPAYHYRQAEDALNDGDYRKAAAEFDAAGDYRDASIREVNARRSLEIVDDKSCEFGEWRGMPVKWRVLSVEDGRALLISEDILAVRQYDGLDEYNNPDGPSDWENAEVTWADSDIRAWLNDDFLNEIFSMEEQKSILLSEIPNPDNMEYGTPGGKKTEDKLFLLSTDEATKYFKDYEDRIAEFMMEQADLEYELKVYGEYYDIDQDNLDDYERYTRDKYLNQKQEFLWWLRSPGNSGYHAAFVHDYGYIYDIDFNVRTFLGVRPALYIDLGSGIRSGA